MSYGSHGNYYQPPPAAAYYPPQPPVDPFRAYYADRLRELTFNSRPIIQDLSIIALQQRDMNQWDRMKIIVEELEVAVLRAPPHQKLPLLYLIDSISKNIGSPYTDHLLPPIIPRLYLKTYREVDGVTKSKMEEMMNLWRSSGVAGGELYPQGVRESIERDIFGSMLPPPPTHYSSAPPLPPIFPTQHQVQLVLNATLEAKHRHAAANPYDRTAATQVAALIQIGELLSTKQVPAIELQQIMDQLKGMGPLPPPTPPGPVIPTAVNLPTFPPSLPREQYRPPPPPKPTLPLPIHSQSISTPIPPSAILPAAPHVPPNPAIAPIPALPDNFADMLRNLTSSGILSTPRTPEIPPAKLETVKKSTLDAYEDLILNMNLTLRSLDLNLKHSLPTAHLPIKCKQCGMRFPDGDNDLQAHMDWHFRRNRKERESEGRGAHRRWLPRAGEWVNDIPEAGPSSLSPSKINGTSGPANSSGQPQKLTAERLASLRKKWVRVPQNTVKAATPCPVCKESFKSEWSEDEEEWIWRNAVDVNGTIYHATCRAESLSSAVAARLMNNAEPRARSASRSPSKHHVDLPVTENEAGLEKKRKVESGEGGDRTEEVDPGVKRVKIETGSNSSHHDESEIEAAVDEVNSADVGS